MITARDICKLGMMSVEEVDLLQDIAKQMKSTSPTVVNIGAGTGTSACAILEVRPDAFIWSIDPKAEPRETDALNKTGLMALNRCFRVLAKSQRFVHFPYEVDLCFVDGAHHDDAVRKDIEVWLPKVKNGGFILFHDYNHPNLPGLKIIVDDMMAGHKRLGSARYLVAFRVKHG